MCLGEVGQVRAVPGGASLVIESRGRTRTVSALLLERPAAPGDWVLAHAGFALEVLSAAQAQDLLAARAEVRP